MRVEVYLDLPDQLSDENLEQLVKEYVVYRLFEDRKISSGRAAELLGMTRRDFMESCQRRGVPIADYTISDLESDLKVFDRKRKEPADDRSF